MTTEDAITHAAACELDCDKAAVIFKAALARLQRSRSDRNRRAYAEASEALELAADRSRAAIDAIAAAQAADRRAAIAAGRAAAAARQPSLFGEA